MPRPTSQFIRVAPSLYRWLYEQKAALAIGMDRPVTMREVTELLAVALQGRALEIPDARVIPFSDREEASDE